MRSIEFPSGVATRSRRPRKRKEGRRGGQRERGRAMEGGSEEEEEERKKCLFCASLFLFQGGPSLNTIS